MKNIHVLPTDKPSRVRIGNNGNFVIGLAQNATVSKNDSYTNQNIYITSDEEIKDADWCFHSNQESIIKIGVGEGKLMKDHLYLKKIILTTDQDLIKDGIQEIPNEFLEWFVNNPSCEEVTIRKKSVVKAIVKGIGIKSFNSGYKIITPKSELASKLKQILDNMSQGEFDEEWKKITDLKLEGPSIIIPKEEPKQETLEEAAAKYARGWGEYDDKKAFIKGAKWQQERMYNEEEVLNFTQTIIQQYKLGNTNIEQLDLLKETLQQFKNK